MEDRVSEILENILGLLELEGSFEVVENPEEIEVAIEATDPGRLIGVRGETLDALQLIVNQILSRQLEVENKKEESFKRVVIDVKGWRKSKEEDLANRAKEWAKDVLESAKELELDPMPSWQRRIIHMTISEAEGVESESIGEGYSRHLVIKPAVKKSKKAKKVKTEKPKE